MIQRILLFAWNTLAALAACLTLPGSVELLLLSAAALIPFRRKAHPLGPLTWRTAVVIPAHNEEANIAACVENLRDGRPPAYGTTVAIFVIADNCTDSTAKVAARAGARVLERTDAERRGKGYALDYAFSRIFEQGGDERKRDEQGFDCVLVVDADTYVAQNFVAAASNALRAGQQAVQARYLVRNAKETVRSRLMSLAIRAFNVVRPLGREHLGLSCGITGNGFGLRRDTLAAVPYLATSIVEDIEYHIALVRSGRRVTFLNHTAVYPETPLRSGDIESQRSRWEGGRLRMLAAHAPSLLRDVRAGRLRCMEPLIELLLLPLAFHVTLLAVAASATLPMVRAIGVAGGLIVLLHLLAAIVAGGGDWSDLAVLAAAPFYILWKLMLIPALVRNSRSDKAWVRTGRNNEQHREAPAAGKPAPDKAV